MSRLLPPNSPRVRSWSCSRQHRAIVPDSPEQQVARSSVPPAEPHARSRAYTRARRAPPLQPSGDVRSLVRKAQTHARRGAVADLVCIHGQVHHGGSWDFRRPRVESDGAARAGIACMARDPVRRCGRSRPMRAASPKRAAPIEGRSTAPFYDLYCNGLVPGCAVPCHYRRSPSKSQLLVTLVHAWSSVGVLRAVSNYGPVWMGGNAAASGRGLRSATVQAAT